jgi:O-antigen/teichoic acid export membrane protein
MPDSPLTTNDPAPSITILDAPAGSLKNLAIRGVAWTIAGFGVAQVLRFGFNLALTRLLFPELFGLMALVYAIVSGVTLFCDIGTAPAVIRDPRGDDPVFLNTVWTLQIARGFGLAFLCLLLAAPVASFYGDHRLKWVLPVIGLSSIVAGFTSTSLLTLQRRISVKRIVRVEVGTQALSGAVMIAWAWFDPGIWALLAGTLASAVIRLVWSHTLIPERRDRLAWEPAALREVFKFGRWIWLASVLTFLASQIDRLILGKLLALQMLGIYSIALAISDAPRGLTLSINNNVIYPAYSKAAGMPRAQLREKILRHRWPLLVIMACVVTSLAVSGDIIIRLFYDKRYAAGAWMLQLLALGVWPSALSYTIDSSLFAIGQPRYAPYGNLSKLLFTAVGIPLGFRLFGVAGAVIAVALNDLPYYVPIAYGLWREGLNSFAQDTKATALLLAMLTVALMIRSALGFGSPIHGLF